VEAKMATRTKISAIRRPKSKGSTRTRTFGKAASYMKKLSTAVREHFTTATDLPTFLAGAGELAPEQRKLIVGQALILIEQNYAHLPLKRAMHSVDPVQRLKLLLQTLESASTADQPSELEFHRELSEIFTSVRDLHTNYLLPAPFNQMTAFLPFAVEDYYENGRRKYIVSHIVQGFSHPTFVPGVEVVYWNGMPIERAVRNNSQRYAGSNREARHARGVQSLTTRALRIAPPPDEEWVVVGYRTMTGQFAELRFDWQVNPPLPSGVEAAAEGALTAQASLGLDLEQDIVRRMRLALFAPQVVAEGQRATVKAARGGAFGDLETQLPSVFAARPVNTPADVFGYLRIWTFNHWPPEEFVSEFMRLISALPQNGLIIDVRGNGGGVIMNGELILQTLTPRRIEPEPLQFINTPLNLEICRRNGATSAWADLSAWVESMQQALQTGSVFSAGFPITEPEPCNAIGQKYFGPVVLITDALCYSTTDIFAAGFQDHEIGPILGTDGNTGAGGANVWEHRYFVSHVLPGSVYQALPNGAGMRVSIRRTLRVGRRAGAPLEDLGVVPGKRHFLTRNDLLNGNVDLINEAGSLLSALPVRALKVTIQSTSPTQAVIVVETQGITRLDIYVDERPNQSIDIQGGQATFQVPRSDAVESRLEIRGFNGTQRVARYRTSI
jgi:Peptidase family S41